MGAQGPHGGIRNIGRSPQQKVNQKELRGRQVEMGIYPKGFIHHERGIRFMDQGRYLASGPKVEKFMEETIMA